MMKYSLIVLFVCTGLGTLCAQEKQEHEYRIQKAAFPTKAFEVIEGKLEGAKRVKYYKEMDSAKISYEVKFKKNRLWYSVEFTEEGALEDIEIAIKEADIPNDSYATIRTYLKENFTSYRIQKIQQQYIKESTVEQTLKHAFQNLMIPSLNYELIIDGKKDKAYQKFEILFDAEGKFKKSRKSLPPNYDHVLY